MESDSPDTGHQAAQAGSATATRPMAVGVPNRFPNSSMNGLLVRVLARQAINVAFQPIIALADSHVVGYEALARPVGGGNDVGSFFAAAEKQGVIKDLDSLCRRAAISTGRRLPQDVFLS